MKKVGELESQLVNEKEIKTKLGDRIGQERKEYRRLRKRVELMNIVIKDLQKSMEKKDEHLDDAMLMQDELQAKLDTATMFLNCVKNKGNIFYSSKFFCEICWLNHQEVTLNCNHGICINCVIDLIVIGQPTSKSDEENSDEGTNYLEFYMCCPLCREIISSVNIVK